MEPSGLTNYIGSLPNGLEQMFLYLVQVIGGVVTKHSSRKNFEFFISHIKLDHHLKKVIQLTCYFHDFHTTDVGYSNNISSIYSISDIIHLFLY